MGGSRSRDRRSANRSAPRPAGPTASPDAQALYGNSFVQGAMVDAAGQEIEAGDVLIPPASGVAAAAGDDAPRPDHPEGITHPESDPYPMENPGHHPDVSLAPESSPIPLNPYHGDFTQNRDHLPLFSDEPTYDDPEQGALGDCYLIASLSAIAQQDPERIRNMVTEAGPGRYRVRFWIAQTDAAGREFSFHDEFVDANIPMSGMNPHFAGSSDFNENWVSIVERGYAQFAGSYEGAHAGRSDQVLEELTGVQSDTFMPGADAIQRIERALANDHPVVADTVADDQTCEDNFVVSNHAYTVLAADSARGTLRIRNPWRQASRAGTAEQDITLAQLRAAFRFVHINMG